MYTSEKIQMLLSIEQLENIESFGTIIVGVEIQSLSPIGFVVNNEKDAVIIITESNKFIVSISKLIPRFSECLISEIDYYANFDLNEFGYEYITDELWKLTRCGISNSHYSISKYDFLRDYPCIEFNENYTHSCLGNVYVTHYRDCCQNKIVPINNAGKTQRMSFFFW